jgi:hypothetical protein
VVDGVGATRKVASGKPFPQGAGVLARARKLVCRSPQGDRSKGEHDRGHAVLEHNGGRAGYSIPRPTSKEGKRWRRVDTDGSRHAGGCGEIIIYSFLWSIVHETHIFYMNKVDASICASSSGA